jgi:hypothetical protein
MPIRPLEDQAIFLVCEWFRSDKDAHRLIARIRKKTANGKFDYLKDTQAMKALSELEYLLVKLHDGNMHEVTVK